MNTAIDTHRETALESPYSRDREEAIEELGRVYADADADGRRRVLETLREVAHDASGRSERDLARGTLVDCFEVDPSTAAPVVVDAFCELAESSKFSEERLDAIDALREFHPDVGETHREAIGETLADIAGNATYEDERGRARRRLSDISREERGGGTAANTGGNAVGYLAESLAEHLVRAADEGHEACLTRAQEVSEFVVEHPVADDAYADVRDDLQSLVEQLEVVPTGGSLDEDRKARVERIGRRVERLYARH